ncbi:vacuolar protein sorting 18 [Emiliania huxleyi CCMP1516]|uniref:Pep3/Vps18 beta-propeller domain-containing protein n=2 Tax=Emiliania huxleyi TaxID=2903 RepID=A0A0D3I2U2_EMIH1|nr:vacuolar protein sorting 18 [Emiliania huxleyi CCMP1516]EOD05577.1 vacuolar protein sorting 18 [Emiliania huxleyi CCMP1516]|eukprot:XP_005758006.1 vacuolar protein sorting 18 [Emiliania huxleyi CCMP1516]
MPADSSAAAIVALDPAWRPAATESLRLAAAGDGVLYLLTSPSGGGGSSSGSAPSLRRLTLATGEEEVLELSRVSATPAGLFADPHSSTSVLIAHANGDTVYVHRSRSRVLGKARGLLITAVAWLRPDPSRSDTREVLLGSSSGAIFEAALEPTRTSRYRQLFTLSPPAPLCGLAAEPFVSQGAPDDKRLFVLAATPTRYYEFVGPASLEARPSPPPLASRLPLPARPLLRACTGHVEVEGPPPGTAWPPPHKGSSLDFDRRRGQEGGGRGSGASPPSAFAWLSARGVYCGSLLFGAQAPRDSCVYDSELHLLVLYGGGVAALSRLSGELMCVARPPAACGPLLGLVREPAQGGLWAWGEGGTLRVSVNREERHMWRLHLEARDFETALACCSPGAPSQRDLVLAQHAEHELSRGAYTLAARQFAKTGRSVEEVALRFLSLGQKGAPSPPPPLLSAVAAPPPAPLPLSRGHRRLSRPTTYALLEAAGRHAELAHYAQLCGDHERLLLLHLERRQPAAAIAQLRSLLEAAGGGGGRAFPEAAAAGTGGAGGSGGRPRAAPAPGRGRLADRRAELQRLVEQFAAELLSQAPAETVGLWLCAPFLDPLPLLPALMRYDERRAAAGAAAGSAAGSPPHHGIRYLTRATAAGCRERDVHNYLLLLHARRSADPPLLAFLEGSAPPAGEAGGEVAAEAVGVGALATSGGATHYEPDYALRVCQRHGRRAACVRLYQLRGDCAEAVSLALDSGEVCLAKQSANLLPAGSPLRRRLWLQIARRVLCGRRSDSQYAQLEEAMEGAAAFAAPPGDEALRVRVREAVSLLEECPQLSIDLLLPLFPDFTQMEHLREIAEELRQEAEQLRSRRLEAPASQPCDSTELPSHVRARTCGGGALGGHRCVVFPCGHAFRLRCLERARAAGHERVRLGRADAEALVAECPLCGSAMVASATKPLVDPVADAELLASWAV